MLRIGDPAPDFVAPDQERRLHRLSDYRGRWVLLYFYSKDETAGCTAEACGFRDVYPDVRDRAVFLGVSADSVESHQAFAAHHRLPFPLLSDPDRAAIRAYGAHAEALGKRTSFLIDPAGNIARIYEKVVPEEHAAQVMEDLSVTV
ncbi:MAG: peroxiredoxin [Candidatus Peribacteraceae bacterium]|nr:peroxiredoxin [Candidatus Peribacteraceae bacterium]